MKVGIIGAVAQEVELLFEALNESDRKVRVVRRGPLEFREGILGGSPVVVVTCGVGKVNAALCAQILISEFAVDAVINTGAAGGLARGLAVFDIVVSVDVVQHDFDTTAFGYELGRIPGTPSLEFKADPWLRGLALDAFASIRKDGKTSKMVEGRVASGDVFVADEGAKAMIQKTFNPACVEMEGGAIAQVCALHGVPFVVLRSISDLAGTEANISYDDFSREASRISARMIIAMVSKISERSTNT